MNVVSEMLSVLPYERPRIEALVPALVRRPEPAFALTEVDLERAAQAATEIGKYMGELIAARRGRP